MIDKIRQFYKSKETLIRNWSTYKLINLFLFNIFIAIMLLLHSAGYFAPYFPMTINIIILISVILSVFLLGAKSKAIFTISLTFWLFAMFLKLLGVDVWAERTSVYCFEALLLGVILMFLEKR